MPNEAVRRKLEIVQSPCKIRVRPEDFMESQHQSMLFPSPRRGLLIFVYFPDTTGEEFKKVLETAKPGHIIELRSAPRFDYGSLNRQLAFKCFSDHGSTYVDLTANWLSSTEPDQLLTQCRSFFKRVSVSVDRPLMLLMNKRGSRENLTETIRKLVTSFLPEIREVLEVPHA